MVRNKSTNSYEDIKSRIVGVSETIGNISVLFYGRSGTGKTTLAASFPKPILLLDIKEQGNDSIADYSDDEIKVLPVKAPEDIEQVYWLLKSGDHSFKTVVIDTVTQLQEIYMDDILEQDGKDFATKKDWGTVSGLMKTWIINFRDLTEDRLDVVFLAQERVHDSDSEDDLTDGQLDPSVGPRLMPSVAAILNASVKVIGNTFIREVVKRNLDSIDRKTYFCLRVGPHPYYITKIRKPKNKECPEYINDPTYDKIIDIMKGRYEPNKKKTVKKKATTGTSRRNKSTN